MRALKHVVRRLARRPANTLVVILTFGLTVGLNSAVFSLVNAVLLRPLPFAEADRLVVLWTEVPQQGRFKERMSEPEYQDLQESGAFARLGALATMQVNLTGGGAPEQIEAAGITSGLLPLLGAQPLLGRGFLPEDDRPGAPKVVLLSAGFWGRRFGSDPSRIGQTLILDGQPYTIIGVLPPSLRLLGESEVWIPLGLDPGDPTGRGVRYLKAIGQLAAGTSPQQAGAELETLADRLQRSFPDSYPQETAWRFRAVPLLEEQVGEIRPGLLLLLGIGGLVLLIACVNIANLWLSDVWDRKKDFAVQVAFGASRGLILRQLLLQGVVLGLLGGGLGALLAHWALHLYLPLAPTGSQRLHEASFDLGVFAFSLLLSLLVGLLVSVIPAFQASGGVSDTLREAVGRASQSLRSRRVRGLFVAGEIALALVVVIGAGLLLKNLFKLQEQSKGFEAAGVLTASLTLPAAKYPSDEQKMAFYGELLRQVKGLPGVEAASVVSPLPLSGRKYSGGFSVEGLSEGGASAGFEALRFAVGPGYFQALGIPVLRGRAFSEPDHDTAARVVIIDETLADRFWPDGNAVGKRLKQGRPDSDDPWLTVVGVVANVKSVALDEDALPQMYFPYGQLLRPEVFLVLRSSSAEPERLADGLRNAIRQLDPDQPVATVRTMEDWLADSLSRQRFLTLLLTSFAALGLVLAALGIYAVMSSFVIERTYEMAIRLAVGALPQEILLLLFRQSLLLGAGGLAVGLGGTLLLAPVLASQLYRLSPFDPWVYLLAATLLLATSFLATYVPARKVARLDPSISLRNP